MKTMKSGATKTSSSVISTVPIFWSESVGVLSFQETYTNACMLHMCQ